MKLKDFVAGPEEPGCFQKPFFILDQWVGATDRKSAVFVKTRKANDVDCWEGPVGLLEKLRTLVFAKPLNPSILDAEKLHAWAGAPDGEERPGVLLGVQIDRSRLAKLIQPIKKGAVKAWNATKQAKMPAILISHQDVWRVALAGYSHIDEGTPKFGSPSEQELFDMAQDM